jgi:protein tyrosine phosphatase (PTP) superfamily phosphohydrolase (DUF442 family)
VSAAPNEGLKGGPAFTAATTDALPRVAPGEYDGLHNVFALSANIISGSEPSSAGLEVLKKLGVRTIISVDGKVPDSASARSFGMRYVHIPLQYKTITDEEVARLAKTFRECEAPFFVHCFHGKHRGPSAAAIGRRALDGATPARAIAEMRQWAGTAPDYEGLYTAVFTKEIPSAAATRALAFDFPAADLPQGLADWMCRIERMNDALRKMAAHEWRVDPRHPDLTPHEAARNLAELTAADWCQGNAPMSAAMSALKNDTIRASEALVNIVATGDNASKSAAHKALLQSCIACHKLYRNN